MSKRDMVDNADAHKNLPQPAAVDQLTAAPMEHLLPPPPHVPVELIEGAVNVLKIGFFALAGIILCMTVFLGPLPTVKWLVAAICICMGLVFLAIIYMRNVILFNLMQVEELGTMATEETIMQMHEARHGLAKLSERMESFAHPAQHEAVVPELLKNVGPLFGMLMKKETSMLSWAMFGAKVAKNVLDALKKG